MRKKKILFVSHKANRSGAPMLLHDLIESYKAATDATIRILCMENGELIPAFQQLGKVYTWQKDCPLQSTWNSWMSWPFRRTAQVLHNTWILFRLRNSHLAFFNTITNGHLQKKIQRLRIPSVCYVHELEAAIHSLTSDVSLSYTLAFTRHFLCVSEAVRDNLISRHALAPEKCTVVASAPVLTEENKARLRAKATDLQQKLPNADVFIAGICGVNEWRKGFDLLLPLSKLYFHLFPSDNLLFVWKGFDANRYNSYFDQFDYGQVPGLSRVLLLPHGPDAVATIAWFDTMLLLSREDPYPLVVLEAAALGIPTICFSNAGGAPEFVKEDCGLLVDYGDLYQMAQAIHRLYEDRDLRSDMGLHCQRAVKARHDRQKSFQQIAAIIDQWAIGHTNETIA